MIVLRILPIQKIKAIATSNVAQSIGNMFSSLFISFFTDLKKKIVRIHEHICQSKSSPTKPVIILYKVLYYSHKLEIRCCLSITYPHRHAFDLFVKKNQHLHFARHFHSFFLGILILLRIIILFQFTVQKIREITFDKKYANHVVFFRGRSV